MSGFRTLKLYRKAFENAGLIFELTKTFPKEKRYGLSSQIRNSSRSVCAITVEAYRKRRYPNHYISKMTDVDMENSETIVWLDFAIACEYISKSVYDDLHARYEETGRLIHYYIENPDKFA